MQPALVCLFPLSLTRVYTPHSSGWLQATIVNGARASASTSYLYPVIGRSNLDVVLNTRAEKIARTGESGNLPVFRTVNLASNGVCFARAKIKRATLTLHISGMGYTATANREVILSAGAFNTWVCLLMHAW
jgi:choline dehydrogenase-like flavoprotein